MVTVRDLSKAEKLEIYKKTKGWCLNDGCWSLKCMKNIMDAKAEDVMDILDYEMCINPMERYKDFSYGRA